ncbi:integration host factor subunit beta [Prolixibacteraceae bacterium JC049]|nr:integration host factor subunit beta [Prolixibacteraceae bacterium JC049]
MTKNQLINRIAEKNELNKKEVEAIVSLFLYELTEVLSDERVTIKDFGSFNRVTRSARIARNPITGEKINVPAKEVIKFKAHKALLGEAEIAE